MDRPVLFCYDGSEGSKTALSVAVELVMHPADAVVLVVWTPIALQLARGGSLLAAVPNEGEMDEEESATAQHLADEGAEAARGAVTTPLPVRRGRTSRWARRSRKSLVRSTPA